MNRRGIGFGFCAIAAFLFSVRYVTGALYSISGIGTSSSYGPGTFQDLWLNSTGTLPLILSIISLIISVVYLVGAETENK
ncbi:hypothetical protein NC661_04725 [Aquibacillus koreensis]|uniref:Uncharacterized protein n=1 Tax=Aquibacillus koreensis TaxID=279446 RepID=A0A9X3WLQ6_9BACI|nr:hypothetical protein [Aquibacillus koreensis]MCT2534721.1 hypothetical protein [Aquibacillus koreensis]MDC3419669.1 hypothetical protein [Aquibacillus koreensis]